MTTTLGSCPCCGHRAEFGVIPSDQADAGGHFVCCLNPACQLTTGLVFALGEDPRPLLAERWNRRPSSGISRASADVIAERRRQVEHEGWTPTHDDGHDAGELASGASAYALAAADLIYPASQGDGGFQIEPPPMWPPEWLWKPADPRRMLEKSAAMAIAEMERLDREAA